MPKVNALKFFKRTPCSLEEQMLIALADWAWVTITHRQRCCLDETTLSLINVSRARAQPIERGQQSCAARRWIDAAVTNEAGIIDGAGRKR